MFFIGIFGIDSKEKEIKIINSLCCKNCNISNSAKLVKIFTFFHFFFIPLFKWNESYYVICNGCNSIYSISKEKGKAIEKGEDIEITYWDLNEVNNNSENYYSINRCPKCNREIDRSFEYCPYCGEKLKKY
ncbi:zinc ribbon domain-containing protein [Clostridioides difficile]